MRWYGIMYLVGFALGWLGGRAHAKQPWSRIKPEQVDDIVFYCALGAIVGGRVGYMFIYGLSELIADPLSILKVWQGGMSFHGGFVGVLVAMWLFGRQIKQPFFVVTDFVAPWTTFGLVRRSRRQLHQRRAVGQGDEPRCAVGRHRRRPGAPREPALRGLPGRGGRCSSCYGSIAESRRPTMATSALFLIVYGVARFIVEFVRVPDQQIGYLALGWVTMGQVLSAPMIIAGVVLLVLAHRRGTEA